jgi:hypothetical protein
MEMEVETSLVGDGNYSKEVFKGFSTQRQKEEEVQRTYAWPNKEGLKRGMDRKEKRFDLEVGMEGLPFV